MIPHFLTAVFAVQEFFWVFTPKPFLPQKYNGLSLTASLDYLKFKGENVKMSFCLQKHDTISQLMTGGKYVIIILNMQ